ncbi:AraC family transcriptional regulator [Massilia sp. Root133]|uniref:AraC family transcriptional regulator n=1 Tax=unclassified Massilia TaxID=2609279 RepID=UPI0006FD8D8B|nr:MULTISPECIES: AraC family transcriptional regulator [unclassified Massilia]KQY14145.1 AraC family transcriptional regulator [Massilia sp. Root133]KQZ40298.1 AraC family transcriptional regulator [Massilia sp. Root1485]
MIDPLADVVGLLRPGVRYTKIVGAAGRWGVRRTETGEPSYCVVLDGACLLTAADMDPIALEPGDFVLIPATYDFSMSSLRPPPARDFDKPPAQVAPGEVRHGTRDGSPDVRFLIGHCEFAAPDAALLVSLLPRVVHVRGEARLATLVQLVNDEARAGRPARDVVLARLLEVLLIEALRGAGGTDASPGLVRGLADPRLAHALRALHAAPERAWTVADLAREAALSRSTFFERFSRTVGVAPMAYLLTWRMALAQDLLRRGAGSIAEVAERVGYSSASTFTVAFARHVGEPPGRYARAA